MPNPPITVGELVDVPAPESPVNAQFHQEVAHRIVHRFPTQAAVTAWAAGNGSLAYASDVQILYVRRGGDWWPVALQSSVDAVVFDLDATQDRYQILGPHNKILAAGGGSVIIDSDGIIDRTQAGANRGAGTLRPPRFLSGGGIGHTNTAGALTVTAAVPVTMQRAGFAQIVVTYRFVPRTGNGQLGILNVWDSAAGGNIGNDLYHIGGPVNVENGAQYSTIVDLAAGAHSFVGRMTTTGYVDVVAGGCNIRVLVHD